MEKEKSVLIKFRSTKGCLEDIADSLEQISKDINKKGRVIEVKNSNVMNENMKEKYLRNIMIQLYVIIVLLSFIAGLLT